MSTKGRRSSAFRGTTPEMRENILWAEARAWVVRLTGGHHLVFAKPGCPPVYAPFTGRPRSALATRSRLRRAEAGLLSA